MKQKAKQPVSARVDSLIKKYVIEESDAKIYKYKITFTTVKDINLVYYTNNDLSESLKKLDTNFIIAYEFSKTHDLVDESEGIHRIIKVKLPKLPKN